MKAYGVSMYDIQEAVRFVSSSSYENNLILDRLDSGPGRAVNFTLRVKSSRERGHRFSWTGRRLVSACWHAHRDVMMHLFDRFPNMKLRSAFSKYDGRVDFLQKFPDTYYRNVGSVANPQYYGALCDCGVGVAQERLREAYENQFRPRISHHVSFDEERWTPHKADEAIDDWNKLVAEIKAKTVSRKVKQ